MMNRRHHEPMDITLHDVTAVVKWYNPTKGFGFVQPSDGSPDAFLHVSVVEQAGHDDLPEGTTLVCDISEGRKGPQVAAIHRIQSMGEGGGHQSRGGGQGHGHGQNYGGGNYGGGNYGGGGGGGGSYGGGSSYGGGASETVEGTVKFFNAEKGFGFVSPDDGGKDVYISARTLQRTGMASLEPNQRVRLVTRMGQKGPMADRIEIL